MVQQLLDWPRGVGNFGAARMTGRADSNLRFRLSRLTATAVARFRIQYPGNTAALIQLHEQAIAG